MIRKDLEMNKVLADVFITMVHEYDLPVNAKVGVPYMDSNGDCMVNVNIQFDEQANKIVDKYLSSAMDHAAEALANGRVAV